MTRRATLADRVAALEAENERRLDEIKRLLALVLAQSETLQMLVDRVGDDR
jgi:hypothetical protein